MDGWMDGLWMDELMDKQQSSGVAAAQWINVQLVASCPLDCGDGEWRYKLVTDRENVRVTLGRVPTFTVHKSTAFFRVMP